jgi:hypothetical protein
MLKHFLFLKIDLNCNLATFLQLFCKRYASVFSKSLSFCIFSAETEWPDAFVKNGRNCSPEQILSNLVTYLFQWKTLSPKLSFYVNFIKLIKDENKSTGEKIAQSGHPARSHLHLRPFESFVERWNLNAMIESKLEIKISYSPATFALHVLPESRQWRLN